MRRLQDAGNEGPRFSLKDPVFGLPRAYMLSLALSARAEMENNKGPNVFDVDVETMSEKDPVRAPAKEPLEPESNIVKILILGPKGDRILLPKGVIDSAQPAPPQVKLKPGAPLRAAVDEALRDSRTR